MYQIKCDSSILFDPRDDALVVLNPKCKLEVNTCGEASFTILPNHPHINALKKLRSVFEIKHGTDVIFRGRMTNDTKDFNNSLDVDLEGVLAYANDTIIPPFKFNNSKDAKAGDHDEQFADAANANNVVAYLLQWVIDKHNEQASDFQKFQLGNVTVTDPNNTIVRSEEGYSTTWDVLRSKFFESSLGGYLVVRYGANGVNYIDYLSAFSSTHPQRIVFGENLMDIERQTTADETYTAMLPTGAETERTESAGDDYKGAYVSIDNTMTVKEALTLESLPDGALSNDGDIVKKGKFIYSKSGVQQYGWICMPIDESKFEDVTEVDNLKTKAIAALKSKATTFAETIRVQGLDLHFTDSQIAAFRIARNVRVQSAPHNIDGTYPLERLELDLLNPQNTIFTIGATERVLSSRTSNAAKSIANIESNYATNGELIEKVNQLENTIVEVVKETDKGCKQVYVDTTDNILLSVSKTFAKQEDLNDVDQRLESAEGKIEVMPTQILQSVSGTYATQDYVEAQLELKIGEDDNGKIISMINASADDINIESDTMTIKNSGFELKDGHVSITDGELDVALNGGGKVTINENWSGIRVAGQDHSAFMQIDSRLISVQNSSIGIMAISFDEPDPVDGLVGHLYGTWYIHGAGSSTPITSDETKKNNIQSQADVYSRIFDRLKPVTFKYKNGTSDRTHTGLIAQDVEQAVLAEGLTTKEFAALCYDTDESGRKKNYGVRYEELVSMCIKEIQTLKAKVAALEGNEEK